MTDMTEKIFEVLPYGKAALKKMGDVPENFRLYSAELKGKHPNYHGMKIEGAEFRQAKTGKNKGKLSILIKGTKRSAYVTTDEIRAEDNQAKQGGEE
jgi:hypothetical protein